MTEQSISHPTTAVPGWLKAAVGAASLALLCTGVGEAVLAVARAPSNWATFGFSAIVSLSAFFGVLFSLGKLRDSPAMTLACITFAILVSSVLGYLGWDRWFVKGISRNWWLMGRALLVLGLLAATTLVALGHSRPAWRSLLSALLAATPSAAIGAWYALAGLRPLLTASTGLAEGLRVSALVVGACMLLASACATFHYAVRAFELAAESRESKFATDNPANASQS